MSCTRHRPTSPPIFDGPWRTRQPRDETDIVTHRRSKLFELVDTANKMIAGEIGPTADIVVPDRSASPAGLGTLRHNFGTAQLA